MFADDLLLFASGHLFSVTYLNQFFRDFSAASGLHENLKNSSVYFGDGDAE